MAERNTNNSPINISNMLEIRDLALNEKVSYEIAKIMFNNGEKDIDKETAQKIFETMQTENMPMSMLSDLYHIKYAIKENYQNMNELYWHISEYANKPIIAELDKYITSNVYYGKAIVDLMKAGYNIKEAIEIFDQKVEEVKKQTNLSEVGAFAKLLFFKADYPARIFEEAYNENNCLKGEPYKTVKEQFVTSKQYKHAIKNGIHVVSATDEGLNDIVNLINKTYQEGDEDYLKLLTDKAQKYKLTVTDINLSNTKVTHYDPVYYSVFIDSATIKSVRTFFHETTHFLDNIYGKEHNSQRYSLEKEEFKKIITEIESKVKVVPRGISLYNFYYRNAQKYIKDPELNRKWLATIKRSKPTASKKEIKEYMQQRKMYEYKRYLRLIIPLVDIYDGISKGKILSSGLAPGHGKKYYADEKNILIELIANIGSIYNLGGIDFLIHELGKELAIEMMHLYYTFINADNPNIQNMTVIEENRNHVK